MLKWECQGKKRFGSRNAAKKEIYVQKEESFGGIMDLRPYKCKYCKGYHLTSSIK